MGVARVGLLGHGTAAADGGGPKGQRRQQKKQGQKCYHGFMNPKTLRKLMSNRSTTHGKMSTPVLCVPCPYQARKPFKGTWPG